MIASDGDIEEGVTSEASSLGRARRSSATSSSIYDDNQISIEDDTDIALTEDVAARYEAYGWHVQTVDWTVARARPVRTTYSRTSQLAAALAAAKAETDTPVADHRCARSSAGPPRPC